MTALVLLLAPVAAGQNLVSNSSFENGLGQPSSWALYALSSNEGKWENLGASGVRCVSVTGNGITCPRYWSTTPIVQAGKPYVLRFTAAASNATGGICLSGFDAVGRYFPPLASEWLPYSYIMAMPNNVTNPVLKLGQCQVNGTYLFDNVELWPVLPIHAEVEEKQLGDGESVVPGSYRFRSAFGGFTANYSRTLDEHTAIFSKDGWLLETNRHITYRHGLAGLAFTNGTVKLRFSQQSGEVIVEASTNKLNWQEAGRFTTPFPSNSILAQLPADLLPATNLFIRLKANGYFWMTGYDFDGGVPDNTTTATGQTWFLEQNVEDSAVIPISIARTPGGVALKLQVRNPETNEQRLTFRALVSGSTGERETAQPLVTPMQSTNVISLALPFAGEGQNSASVEVEDSVLGVIILQGNLRLSVSRFDDNSFGHVLPGPSESPIWWCAGNHKVFRERSLPTATNDAVEISAARNEYEPFQLVLRPVTNLNNVTVSCSSLTYLDAANVPPISSTNIEICLVDYVPVTEIYDNFGALGNYPDPLPPLTAPFNIPAHTNQPIWFTVYVPKNAPAGNYGATVTIISDRATNTVPVRLQVHDFTLSDVSHTRAAYGLDLNTYWHGFPNHSQRLAIYELYMQNFARHRASPYFRETSFSPLWPNWSLVNGQFTHSFADFDAYTGRWLDEFNFNNFKLMEIPLTLGGHARFTPEYRKLLGKLMKPITAHLREKGWLQHAYSFWLDEPQPFQFPYFLEGMQALLEAAPELKRLVAVWEMNAALEGNADILVTLLSGRNFEAVFNRWGVGNAVGEETEGWLCVAGWPLAPLPNNFVDHPSIAPRIRAWMWEKCGVNGDLYWYVNYFWGSNSAPRNPWLQPMTKVHTGHNLGNGDGTLVYPAVKTPPATPVVSGPVNSYRWEILREGQEDREYFWLLRELMTKAERRLGQSHPVVLEGRAARTAALALVTSAAVYETNPDKLLAARRRLAGAIEALNDKSPMIVRQPISVAVASGTTATLRSEAIGWPPPDYQWQRYGTNLPGATLQQLTLAGINGSHLGDYRVIASNNLGTVTSAVAKVAGYWVAAPQLLIHPESLIRQSGRFAVFTVTAVSAQPLSYQWYFNDTLVPGGTSDTLLLTNLSSAQAGSYLVVVTNASGGATSSVASLLVPPLTSSYTLVPTGAVWRYRADGVNLGSEWRGLGYSDAGWVSGPAQLGFGDGDERTVIGYGPSPANKPITTYFRHTFYQPHTNPPASLLLRLLRDDGAVAYLNGVEIHRTGNMPAGAINHQTVAIGVWEKTEVVGAGESTYYPYGVVPTLLRPGTNVLAVEVHQFSPASDDLSLDCELTGTWDGQPQILTQPLGAKRHIGQSITFTVSVASTAVPVSYQWHLDGLPIPAATNAWLTLVQLETEATGPYSVVVSNVAGSVASSPAALTVFPPPGLLGNWSEHDAGFQLTLPPDTGALTVQVSSNLVDWVGLWTLPTTNIPIVLTDTNAVQSPARFYRLQLE